jgi:hypothetical protein
MNADNHAVAHEDALPTLQLDASAQRGLQHLVAYPDLVAASGSGQDQPLLLSYQFGIPLPVSISRSR